MEKINKPNHYTWHLSGVECKDIVQHFNYNLGTAMAYVWRCGYKHDSPVEDLQKAIKHLEFEIDRINRFEIDK